MGWMTLYLQGEAHVSQPAGQAVWSLIRTQNAGTEGKEKRR